MPRAKRKPRPALEELLSIMARLRAPDGCPWDREQTHQTLRFHAVEEVYELLDAIEARDDQEMVEELGDLLLQVVFHAQLARERGAFDFEQVARRIVDKLVRRHPHVFGDAQARTVDAVWAQWEQIKREEKHGTRSPRPSALDGIPKHLPALLCAEMLVKKARRARLWPAAESPRRGWTRASLGRQLFALASYAQARGWTAEELLRGEVARQERLLRRREKTRGQSG